MPTRLICTSHSPLIGHPDSGLPPPSFEKEFETLMASLAEEVANFDPKLVLVFAPDHFNGFYYDVMPPFCIGAEGEGAGDFGGPTGRLAVQGDLAKQLANHMLARGFDPAFSYGMRLDHGFLQPLSLLFGDPFSVPVIPIYINSVAPPQASFERCLGFGRAVGEWIESLRRRVLIIGSGGLSHDPPVPNVEMAPAPQREFLVRGRAMPSKVARDREANVLAKVQQFYRGDSDLLPLNPEWDKWVMEQFASGDLSAIAALETPDVLAAGGRGGQEVRTWLAAYAALEYAGRYEVTTSFYAPANEWLVGLGVMSARPAD